MATEMQMNLSPKEKMLVGLTATLAPLMLVEIYSVAKTRAETPEFATDPNMPQARDLLVGVGFALALIVLRRVLSTVLQPLGRLILDPRKSASKDRMDRFGTVLFKFLYFVVVTAVGYYVLRDEPWLPRALGGSGDVSSAFLTMREAPSDKLKLYYMIQTGYHLQSLLYMVLLSPIRNDFIEMLLHHLVTLLLIVGSYLGNYTAMGALIAFTHDIGDVSGYAIKSVVDSGNIPLVIVFYVGLLATWAYTRLFVLPLHLIYNFAVALPAANEQALGAFVHANTALLCMLQLLHVYWYGLFLVMGYALLFKGKSEDIQEVCRDAEAEGEATGKPKAA